MGEQVQCVILGGGRGTRLYPLTKYRAKPAVPIGGKYRLIDVPISNSLHAGIDRIYVLTQFNSASLHGHINRTYSFDTFSEGFVDILAAEQTQDHASWYQGTADAVRQRLRHILHTRPSLVLILSGDHLYRMDYRAFVQEHLAERADLSVAAKVVRRDEVPDLGVFGLAKDGHVASFHEKPKASALLDELRLPHKPHRPAAGPLDADEPVSSEWALPPSREQLAPARPTDDGPDQFLASMGVYLFRADVLASVLEECPGADFGRDIIPAAIRSHHVHAHRFYGYWEDIGTIRSFYRANLSLALRDPAFSFYAPGAPIYTRPRYLAAARIDGCRIDRAIVGDGSDIREATIRGALLGIRTIVRPGVELTDTIVMGADFYEPVEEVEQSRAKGIPPMGIGEGTSIEGAIIDKNACIGRGVKIRRLPNRGDEDHEHYCIRDGIVVIPKHAVIPDDTVI